MVAAALGVLLGVLFTVLSRWSVSRVTPENPAGGMAIVALMLGVRFAAAIAALGAYFFLAREGFLVFGVALLLAFIAGLIFEAVKSVRPHTTRTSA